MNEDFDKKFREGWSLFESKLRNKLREWKLEAQRNEPPTVNPQLREFLENALKQFQGARFSGLSYHVFETHRSVFVRLALPEEVSPHLARIVAEKNRLHISGIPGKAEETIILPVPVLSQKGRAVFKDGILEIALAKIREPQSGLKLKVHSR